MTNYFSADFHREFVKFCTKLSELLKNNGIIFLLKKLRKNGVKTQKKQLGVFSQVKIGLKKTSRQKNCFLATLVALDFTLVSETLGRSFKLA